MKRIISFFRKEAMLSIALAAAIISMIITPPTGEMIVNLNWKTLSILFMLFTVLEGMKKEKLFNPLIKAVGRIRNTFALSLTLIMIVFILSMFITNDVALLTFVPITILILKTALKEQFIIPVVVLETIAANLGSMATPFGNPQNLYLYEKMGASSADFVLYMLPLVLLSLVLLVLASLFVFKGKMRDEIVLRPEEDYSAINPGLRMFYFCLFAVVLLTVLDLFPVASILLLFILMILLCDKSVFKIVDWPLLATFLCFFLFSSSIAGNPGISAFLSEAVAGKELVVGALLSQVISNVPAAILLEPFAADLKALLYGVDIGGLGTIVASLASLISFRCYAKEYSDKKGAFMKVFTLYNVLFLIVLFIFGIIIVQ